MKESIRVRGHDYVHVAACACQPHEHDRWNPQWTDGTGAQYQCTGCGLLWFEPWAGNLEPDVPSGGPDG